MFKWLKKQILLRKKSSDNNLDLIKLSLFLNKYGKQGDTSLLYPYLEHNDWNVRNAASSALVALSKKYPLIKNEMLTTLHKFLEKDSLLIKLTVLEILGQLKDHSSKPFLIKLLEESDYDLQYAAVKAIGFLDDVDILTNLELVAYVKDYITKRAAILSVIRIVESTKEDIVEKLTPHIHLLFESYIELSELGDYISKILDYGDFTNFSKMRGYTEFAIIKLEELLEKIEYNPIIYQNFAKLIYPMYFPISEH